MRLVALLALAACGDGVPGPDASTASDGSLGLVRVILPGHRESEVFFQNADSSLVLATHSDGSGEANAFMAPGGFVTLVSRDTFSTTLFTWSGVQGGDVLELLRDAPGLGPQIVTMSIPPTDPSTFFHQLTTSCGVTSVSGAEIEPLPVVLERCPAAQVGMLVQTFGDTRRFLFRDAVSIVNNAVISFAGPYLELSPLTVHAVNLPPTLQRPSSRAALVGSDYELFTQDDLGGGEITDASTSTAVLPMPLPPTGTLAWQVRVTSSSGLSASSVTAWGPVASDVTVDFGTPLRHYLSAPHYVPTEHAIRWTEDTAGRIPDGVIVSMPWQRGGSGEGLVWRMIAPRTAEPVIRFPVLPPAELQPGEGALVSDPTVLTGFAVEGGYASVRETLLDSYDQVATWPVHGPAGRVATETLPK